MTERDREELKREIVEHERSMKAVSAAMEAQWKVGEARLEKLDATLAAKRALLAKYVHQPEPAPLAHPVVHPVVHPNPTADTKRGRPPKAR